MKRKELTAQPRAPYDPKRGCGVVKTPETGYENIWFAVPPLPVSSGAGLPLSYQVASSKQEE